MNDLRPKTLLLTGRPGVGKTTVIRRLVAALPDWHWGGFYTAEIRTRGEREGFRIVTFSGEEWLMAHVAIEGPHVGRYGVDVAAIDAVADTALAPDAAADAFLLDEIGKMECLSARFVAATRALLACGTPLVATIAQRGSGFIDEVKRTPGIDLWQVTATNRDALPGRIAAWLTSCR